jgi:hypothetical protein
VGRASFDPTNLKATTSHHATQHINMANSSVAKPFLKVLILGDSRYACCASFLASLQATLHCALASGGTWRAFMNVSASIMELTRLHTSVCD